MVYDRPKRQIVCSQTVMSQMFVIHVLLLSILAELVSGKRFVPGLSNLAKLRTQYTKMSKTCYWPR